MTVQCADSQGRAAQLITFFNRYRDYCNQQLQKYFNQERKKLKSTILEFTSLRLSIVFSIICFPIMYYFIMYHFILFYKIIILAIIKQP